MQHTLKMKIRFWFAIGLLSLLAACRSQPEFINHTPPALTVSSEGIGGADNPLDTLACDEIHAPSNLLGGLNPSHPIVVCVVNLFSDQVTPELEGEIEQGQFIQAVGGSSRSYLRYVISRGDELTLIKTEEEFRSIFAPIDTAEEALSYVLALRRLSAYYGLEFNPAYEYETSTLEDTFVTSEADGYRLHLYAYQLFGCGPHWKSVVDVHVSFDGIITEISRESVFRDPEEDNLCVD